MHHVRIDVAVEHEAGGQNVDVPGVGAVRIVIELEKKQEPARSLAVEAEAVAGPVLVGLGVPKKPGFGICRRLVPELVVVRYCHHIRVQLVDVRHDELVEVVVPEPAHFEHRAGPNRRWLADYMDVEVLEELVCDFPRDREVIWAL